MDRGIEALVVTDGKHRVVIERNYHGDYVATVELQTRVKIGCLASVGDYRIHRETLEAHTEVIGTAPTISKIVEILHGKVSSHLALQIWRIAKAME